MKKVLLSIFSACLFASCSNKEKAATAPVVETKLHWRVPWNTNVYNNANFVQLSSEQDGVAFFKYKNENLCVGSAILDSVRYECFRGKLMRIHIFCNTDNIDKIDEAFNLAYGEGKKDIYMSYYSDYLVSTITREDANYSLNLDIIRYNITDHKSNALFESKVVVGLQKKYLDSLATFEAARQKRIDDSIVSEKRKVCPPNQYYN